jgi:hypothetical protein
MLQPTPRGVHPRKIGQVSCVDFLALTSAAGGFPHMKSDELLMFGVEHKASDLYVQTGAIDVKNGDEVKRPVL